MCQDCGCVETGAITLDGKTVPTPHHPHGSGAHPHGLGAHHHGQGHHLRREINLKQAILSQNDHLAMHNRAHFQQQGITCFNWISAPGSGKTSLLEALLTKAVLSRPLVVIEGDQATQNDATRIRQAGGVATQINTGSACHLDANMVHQALHGLDLNPQSFLMIENVGNMVCPTAFDLGERAKIAVVSVTEGEDKPLKYPDLILTASCLIINKIDLLPYLDFNLDYCLSLVKQVNPNLQIFPLSAKTGEGLAPFVQWLERQRAETPT